MELRSVRLFIYTKPSTEYDTLFTLSTLLYSKSTVPEKGLEKTSPAPRNLFRAASPTEQLTSPQAASYDPSLKNFLHFDTSPWHDRRAR